MTSTVGDMLTGIKGIIANQLGATFKELPFSLDVTKNRLLGGTRGYAAWAGLMNESPGVTGFVTVDQTFEMTLTDSYGSSQTGDAAQRAVGIQLYDRLEAIYVRLVSEKAGSPARVMNVSRLIVEPIQFIDSNVASLRATFDIKYRTQRGP